MDTIFLLTLLFVFLTALVGTFVKRRSRDICLKDFAGYHVTVLMKDGRRLWGKLLVFPNGLELIYAAAHVDRSGHVETSVIFFPDQMAQVRAVYRFHDELTAEHQRSRHREIERTHHPNFFRRLRRHVRNFVNTFRDAFNQSIGLIVSQMKGTAKQSAVLQTQDARLTQMGQSVLGIIPNAYEPILERYIGHRVVVEEKTEQGWIEHPGILKEYSAAWLEILDCRLATQHTFELIEAEQLQVNRDLDFDLRVEAGEGTLLLRIGIENHGEHPVRVVRLEGEEYARELDVPILPGGTGEVRASDLPVALWESAVVPPGGEGDGSDRGPGIPPLRLVIEAIREGDVCFPRSTAVVRHGGEPLLSTAKRLRKLAKRGRPSGSRAKREESSR